MKIGICTIAIGGIYPLLASRMIERFAQCSPGYDVTAWVNCTPPGTPQMIVDGYDYTPYCAKPFAMHELRQQGFDIAILLDAAFFPVKDIRPLVEHIGQVGYYFCDNEFKVGEWCSDACAEEFGVTREALWKMNEISTYCVGMNFNIGASLQLLAQWKSAAYNPRMFPGPHTAGNSGRNHGFVSSDSSVRGHRHDQSCLSIIAHQFGMQELVKRPKLTGYAAREWNEHHLPPTEETVLVNWGKLDV